MDKYFNFHGWTDIEPYELVNVISPKCVEIKAMKSELDPGWKPEWVPGGFSAICTNQASQRWSISSDPAALVIRARLHKNGQWHSPRGRHIPSDHPVKLYDYNF